MDFITLGIGPGGDIASFILVGLTPTGYVEVIAAEADWVVAMPDDDYIVEAR